MNLVSVIIVLGAVGVLLFIVNRYLPVDAMIKEMINIMVIIIVCIWLLKVFNVLPAILAM